MTYTLTQLKLSLFDHEFDYTINAAHNHTNSN